MLDHLLVKAATAKAFLCLTSVLKRWNPPSLLFLPSFGVICCAVLLGWRFERRGTSNFFGFCLVQCGAFCMLVVSLIVSCLLLKLCCCHRRVMRGEYRRKLQAGGRLVAYRVVKSWVAQALGGQKERGFLLIAKKDLTSQKPRLQQNAGHSSQNWMTQELKGLKASIWLLFCTTITAFWQGIDAHWWTGSLNLLLRWYSS